MSQRSLPKLSEWELQAGTALGGMASSIDASGGVNDWSAQVSRREMRVTEALYGVDLSDNKRRLPGLEVLEEDKLANPTPDQPEWDSESEGRVESVEDKYRREEESS